MVPLVANVTVPPPASAARRLASVGLVTTPAARPGSAVSVAIAITRKTYSQKEMGSFFFIRNEVE